MSLSPVPRPCPRPAALVAALALTLVFPAAAVAEFCIGRGCGANDPAFHCHSVNNQGNECWDTFDDSCEDVAGFSLGRGEALSCTDPGSGGAIGEQSATAFAGFNTFSTQIKKGAAPRVSSLREAIEAEEDEGGSGLSFSQIVAAAEHEQWDAAGFEGETNGLRLGWSRQAEAGMTFGIDGSYQQAEPDLGGSTDLINLGLNVGHTLGPVWRWAVHATYSDLSGGTDLQLYGGGGQLAFASYGDNGHVFSGGVIAQYTTSDEDFFEDTTTVSGGLAYGFPIGERMTLDFDGYVVNVIDPDVPDDLFYLVGTQFGFYFTESFVLHLGYRILEGIDDFDSDTITLGFASRWD